MLAPRHPLDDPCQLACSIAWDELEDIPPDDLIWAISVHLLRARIPAGDDSIEGLADDRILRRFDDGC
jgi:hypothetical protein